jgi:hypothetical protein
MDIAITEFLIFFSVMCDAKFGSQGIHAYEAASFVLFIGFFKICSEASQRCDEQKARLVVTL